MYFSLAIDWQETKKITRQLQTAWSNVAKKERLNGELERIVTILEGFVGFLASLSEDEMPVGLQKIPELEKYKCSVLVGITPVREYYMASDDGDVLITPSFKSTLSSADLRTALWQSLLYVDLNKIEHYLLRKRATKAEAYAYDGIIAMENYDGCREIVPPFIPYEFNMDDAESTYFC